MECHWWGKCPSTTQACTWDTAFDWHDCQSMHAICTRGGGGTGTCRWSHSRSYKQCSNKRAAIGADPKNPDDPARPAPAVGAVATSSRRWKNNLLLKSWKTIWHRHTHCARKHTHTRVSIFPAPSSTQTLVSTSQILRLSPAITTESNSFLPFCPVGNNHCLGCTHKQHSPHYLYTYYTYYTYIYGEQNMLYILNCCWFLVHSVR